MDKLPFGALYGTECSIDVNRYDMCRLENCSSTAQVKTNSLDINY